MIITDAISTRDFTQTAQCCLWIITILASSVTASGIKPLASCKNVLYKWRDVNRSTNRVCVVQSNTIAVSFIVLETSPAVTTCVKERERNYLLQLSIIFLFTEYDEELSTTVGPTPGLIPTTTLPPGVSPQCYYEDKVYEDGELIPTQACEHCYCFRGEIACAVQQCGKPMKEHGKNCTALPPPEGECCPTAYQCGK